jgi:hypothetical protein
MYKSKLNEAGVRERGDVTSQDGFGVSLRGVGEVYFFCSDDERRRVCQFHDYGVRPSKVFMPERL